MEQGTQRHIITPTKGICNIPSDLTCDDEQLEKCCGLTNEGGDLKVIQEPKHINSKVNGSLLYIFKHDNISWNISINSGYLYYSNGNNPEVRINNSNIGDVSSITSVGKTLVVATNVGIKYYLFKTRTPDSSNSYGWYFKPLGDIPEPKMNFYLDSNSYDTTHSKINPILSETQNGMDLKIYKSYVLFKYQWSYRNSYEMLNRSKPLRPKLTDSWDDLVFGSYAANKEDIEKDGGFCLPFFVRYGLEMYDGSFTLLSAPKLMMPCLTKNFTGMWSSGGHDDSFIFLTKYSYLFFTQETNYNDWEDIISNVVVFVSKPIEINDITGHALCKPIANKRENVIYATEKIFDSIGYASYNGTVSLGSYTYSGSAVNKDETILCEGTDGEFNIYETTYDNYGRIILSGTIKNDSEASDDNDDDNDTYYPIGPFSLLSRRSDVSIRNEIMNTSVFYRVADLGLSRHLNWTNLKDKMEDNTLFTLESRQSIDKDDYFSHTKLIPNDLYTQNRRLNIYNVKRTFFEGFNSFWGYTKNLNTNNETLTYTAYITIHTDSSIEVVVRRWDSKELITANSAWFYYPDPRAKWLVLKQGNTTVINSALTEHKGLNGAYYFSGLPTGNEKISSSAHPSDSIQKNNNTEDIDNYIIQSEVDNPFNFSSSSYVRVGQGKVIGLAGLTTALSNDAYAIATTLVFTTEGIWAATVSGNGEYSAVAPPFSREVCCNPDSITMTDRMVFFVSKKGLMCVVGTSENSVVCVSEQMSGSKKKEFMDFLESCKIAYDYKSSCLYLYQTYNYTVWVYNIKTQTFSNTDDFFNDEQNNSFLTAVPDYPDYIIQSEDQHGSRSLSSLISKPERDGDTNKYNAWLQSRPMKLDGSTYLKSVRRIKRIDMIDDDAEVTLKIYGSNDLKKWVDVTSTRGKGFRFIKYRMDIKDMKAVDSISGLLLDTQIRYTDRPH